MQESNQQINTQKQQGERRRQIIEKQVKMILNQLVEEVQFTISSGPHQEYFFMGPEKTSKLRQMTQKYHNSLFSKIQSEIQIGKIAIPKVKNQFKIEKKNPISPEKLIEIRKEELQRRKKDVMSNLQQLLKEEDNLIKENNSLLAKSRSLNKSQPTFRQSSQSKSELKLALRKNKEFQMEMQNKQQQIHKRAIDYVEQSKRKDTEVLQRFKQEHLHQLQKRKKRLEQQKNHWRIQKSKCTNFIEKIKPPKYIFEQMTEKAKQKIQLKQQQRKQRLKKHAQSQRRVNWSQLKQHQQRYLQIVEEKKQEWMRKYEQIMGNLVHSRHKTSIFFERIKQAETQKQFEDEEKNRAKKQFLQRIKSYSSNILTNHRPKHFIKSQISPSNNLDKRQSLDRKEERTKGLQFLSEAKKKHRAIEREAKKSNEMKGSSSLPAIKQTVYKDYLKEQTRRAGNETNSQRFNSVLSNRKGQWASNAKSIIEKMDMANRTGDKLLITSAMKKIELLNALI